MALCDQVNQTALSSRDEVACSELCAARGEGCEGFTFVRSSKACWLLSSAVERSPQPGSISARCGPEECSADGRRCVFYAAGEDLRAASSVAAKADVAIVFLGAFSREGSDRSSLSLQGKQALVPAVARAAKTIVCISVPGAVLLPWREEVHAITAAFMPGQEYGRALADVLFGKTNPSAKLPLTFPARGNQVGFTRAQWPGVRGVASYTEKLLVGYRFYDQRGEQPAYPFGHGLSYTSFVLSGLSVSRDTVNFT
ncbi:MAG: hypothetical protein SGPRY_014886, partial [Prymnesium sp.]